MSYIIYAWLASLTFGLSVVIAKIVAKHSIKNMWYFNFIYALFSFLYVIPFALRYELVFPVIWHNLILSSIFDALALVFYTLTLYNLDVSIIGPLFNLRSAFAAILGVFILRETLSLTQIGLILVIFIAGFFVSFTNSFSIKKFLSKSIIFGIIMAFFSALRVIFINKSIEDVGLWETNLLNPLFSVILLLVTIPFFYKDIKKTKKIQVVGIAVSAILVTIGTIFSNFAYEVNVSISSNIVSLPFSMIIVFILSFIWPKLLEKHSLKIYMIRFTCAFIMIFSALKLSGV
jgi:drug/metabolite transporter (DMT)-like permease